jgi:hypothetical protein
MLCGVALFALLRSCGLSLFRDDQQYEATSHGIGVGQGMGSIGLPRLGALITLRIVGRLLRLFAWPMAAPASDDARCRGHGDAAECRHAVSAAGTLQPTLDQSRKALALAHRM